jgi:hypothetical protein
MSNRRPLRLAAALALAASLPAQAVTMTWSAPALPTASTLVAGSAQTQNGVVPVGGVPSTVASTQTQGAESATAQNTAFVAQGPFECLLTVDHVLQVAAPGPGPTTAGASSDFLLQLTAIASEPVAINVGSSLLATAGAAAPNLRVDLDDDGTFEFVSGPPGPGASFARTLGPVPLLVRVRAESSLALTGTLQARLAVSVVATHATQIDVVMVGCSVPYHLYAVRTFGGGMELGTFGPAPVDPILLVLGLGVQPFLLPSSAPTPCVLVPTPDIILLLPGNGSLPLPLPPAVRPVTFWTQGVPLMPSGFEATGVYRVQAN